MAIETMLGWTATTLFTVCYIPQILKTIRTNTVEGLSFLLLLISFAANIVAFIYATLIQQKPLQVKYILAMIFLAMTIAVYLKVHLKSKKQI